MLATGESDARDQVNTLSESTRVKCGPSVAPGEDSLETRVFLLDYVERSIDPLANVSLLGRRLESLPAGIVWNPEHVLRRVLVSGVNDVLSELRLRNEVLRVRIGHSLLEEGSALLETV